MRDDVHCTAFRCQRDVQRLWCRAHSEDKPAVGDVIGNHLCCLSFVACDAPKSGFGGGFLKHQHPLLIPDLCGKGGVEFAVLSCEIFVMEVQPVVALRLQHAALHLFIPNLVVGNLRVIQCDFNGIVPRISVGRLRRGRVDCDFRCLLQQNFVHVIALENCLLDSVIFYKVHWFNAHVHEGCAHAHILGVRQDKRAATVVEPPIASVFTWHLQCPIGEAVCLEMVRLRALFHGH